MQQWNHILSMNLKYREYFEGIGKNGEENCNVSSEQRVAVMSHETGCRQQLHKKGRRTRQLVRACAV